MSSPVPLKRRKINDAANTLRKPFVSPMRSAKPVRTPLKETQNNVVTHQPYLPSTLAHTFNATGSWSKPPTLKPVALKTPAKSFPTRKPPSSLWSSKKKDPAELAAKSASMSLKRQIKKVQNDLDTLKQAKQLSTSSTDAELEALSEKWRLASQAVAEELFGEVKERVQRMGGVAAWREMEKRKHDRAHGMGEFAQEEVPQDDDADCEFDSQGEELPEDEQEYRKKMKRQAKQEMMDAADVPDAPEADPTQKQKEKVWEDNGKDDDTFTMDMMLRSLNIELDVIGYDKGAQKWI